MHRAPETEGTDLGRAVGFGTVAAAGVVLVSLTTLGPSWLVWADRVSGRDGMPVVGVVLVGLGGPRPPSCSCSLSSRGSSTENWRRADSTTPSSRKTRTIRPGPASLSVSLGERSGVCGKRRSGPT